MSTRDNGPSATDDPLSAFSLFCAYHLGLDHQGRRRFSNIHDVARGAGVDVDTVEAALQRHGLDAGSMLERDFDLASAQIDIQASPAGVDLLTLAVMHFDLWCEAESRPRDWAREADDAARDNERIFGDGPKRR